MRSQTIHDMIGTFLIISTFIFYGSFFASIGTSFYTMPSTCDKMYRTCVVPCCFNKNCTCGMQTLNVAKSCRHVYFCRKAQNEYAQKTMHHKIVVHVFVTSILLVTLSIFLFVKADAIARRWGDGYELQQNII